MAPRIKARPVKSGYFVVEGEALETTEDARGSWTAASIHGVVAAGVVRRRRTTVGTHPGPAGAISAE